MTPWLVAVGAAILLALYWHWTDRLAETRRSRASRSAYAAPPDVGPRSRTYRLHPPGGSGGGSA